MQQRVSTEDSPEMDGVLDTEHERVQLIKEEQAHGVQLNVTFLVI